MTLMINMLSSSKAMMIRISKLSKVLPLIAYFYVWKISSNVVFCFSRYPFFKTYRISDKSIFLSVFLSIACLLCRYAPVSIQSRILGNNSLSCAGLGVLSFIESSLFYSYCNKVTFTYQVICGRGF